MSSNALSEYNLEQLETFQAIAKVCEALHSNDIERLKESLEPYLDFRRKLESYQTRRFALICQKSCFETGLSACCGFESIITFFADHAINYLLSGPQGLAAILEILSRPNRTGKCVYLGEKGCLWSVRPISCAMFFCDQAKRDVFARNPEAQTLWEELRREEKNYTWPTKPVVFNDLEAYFIRMGVESPHLYFHKSPGLLRLKAKAGLAFDGSADRRGQLKP